MIRGSLGRLIYAPPDRNARYFRLILSFLLIVLLSLGSIILLDFDGPRRFELVPRFLLWCAMWAGLFWLLRLAPELAARMRVDEDKPRRQDTAVIVTAVLGTILAMAPILFLNQSLLAPGNGAQYFYDTCPSVPGESDCRTEDVHGVDIGAMAWAFLPAVMAQERTIKAFGEFPLWNRYNSAGVSMIGQGQLMLGDPVTWLQWLVGADALSFDLKFVLLRIVFAAALGLAVLTVTGALRPAVIVAITAPFVGFFAHRVNHTSIFSLCYAPLISLAWLRLTYAGDPRRRFWWLAGLMVANWLVLNSGTVKEAYMILVVLNAIGAVHFIVERKGAAERCFWSFLAMLGISGICFAMVALPVAGTFLGALKNAVTGYDRPGVEQFPFWRALSFVDSYFLANGAFVASNVLLASGVCAAVLFMHRFPDSPVQRSSLVLTGGAAAIFATAYGIVPAAVLLAIPFVRNIQHIGDTFAMILLVPTSILAGIGFHLIDQQASKGRAAPILIGSELVFAFLCFVFLLGSAGGPGLQVAGFIVYAPIVLTAGICAPWLLLDLMKGRLSFLGVALCAVVMLLLLGQGATYPKTRLDGVLFSPAQRMSLAVRPDFVDRLAVVLSHEPARVVGIGNVLVPGYNEGIGLETTSGPDAIMVKPYRDLALALKLPYYPWAWRMYFDAKSLSDSARALDLLGVRYLFSSGKLSGLPRVDGDSRISVYERDSAWPRAFFTDRVEVFENAAAFARRLREGGRKPFVAVDRSDQVGMAAASRIDNAHSATESAPGRVIPATDYVLTGNTTSFTIAAPSAGAAYLGEADIPGDFGASVNGKQVPYFTANYAFKAVVIPAPGTYRITFAYWPVHLGLLLVVAAAGACLWVAGMALFWLHLHREAGSFSSQHNGAAA